MSLYESVKARYDACIAEMTQIAQTGVTEGRSLTPEESNKFDGLKAEAEGHAQRMKSIAEGEQRAKDIEESYRGSGQEKREVVESDLAKWAREARNGDSFDLAPVLGAERRALAAVRGSLGGPEARAMSATAGLGKDGVYGQLWEYAVSVSQILQAGADVINTSDGNTLPLPAVTAHATGASAAASASLPSSDAALTTVDLSVTKDAYITLVPSELLQDATFDLEGYLARAAGRELGRLITVRAEAAAIAGFTASGSNPAATAVAAATGSVFSDALIDLFHSVKPEYRTNSSWVMADPIAGLVRKTKDGSGQYVWERSLVPGNPLTIDNKPIYIGTSFDSTAAATKQIVYFGNWEALKVRIAGGLRFERSNDYAFGNDQVAFRAVVRSGAAVVDPNAVKFMRLT